jgi:hypothetical protein
MKYFNVKKRVEGRGKGMKAQGMGKQCRKGGKEEIKV